MIDILNTIIAIVITFIILTIFLTIYILKLHKNNRKNIYTLIYDVLEYDEERKQRHRCFDYVNLVDDCVELYNYIPPLPQRATSKSAGYDVYAPFDFTLEPNEEIKMPTYIKAYMNDGEVLKAYPRSGLGFKYACRLLNTVGIIDQDYVDNPNNEGHIMVGLRNEGTKPMKVKQGEAMCQFIFEKFLLVANDDFENGDVRKGGFGSTTK